MNRQPSEVLNDLYELRKTGQWLLDKMPAHEVGGPKHRDILDKAQRIDAIIEQMETAMNNHNDGCHPSVTDADKETSAFSGVCIGIVIAVFVIAGVMAMMNGGGQ